MCQELHTPSVLKAVVQSHVHPALVFVLLLLPVFVVVVDVVLLPLLLLILKAKAKPPRGVIKDRG
jgi:hypothetical protein